MTVTCVAVGCKNVGVHLFPKDARKRKLWEKAVNRENWKPGPYSKLCQAHFRPNDYSLLMEYFGSQFIRKVLKRTAVPSVFSLTNDESVSSDELEHTERKKPIVTPSLGTVTNGERSVCETCNKHYAKAHILKEHIKYVHEPSNTCCKNYEVFCPTHVCQTCFQRFPIESDLKAHLVKMRFPCKECKKCFGSEEELSFHDFLHEQNELNERNEPMNQTLAQYSCDVCGEQFDENLALKSHVRKHSAMKSYTRKKPKLTLTVNKLTDHSNDTGPNIVTGSELTKLTGTVARIKDHRKDTGPNIVTGSEVTNLTGTVGRIKNHSKDTGPNIVTGSEVTELTGTVGRIKDHSKDTGPNIVTGSGVTKLTGTVGRIKDNSKDTEQIVAENEETVAKTTVKMEQDLEPQKLCIDVDVKREPDDTSMDEPLDCLQGHVETELNMSLDESQEKNVYIKKETEESLFDMTLKHQVKQEPEESGSERTV